jgi:UDP-GlcNAc:undecaprenyl-phosphate/decaprenyl-phosphate GlcNAc-1-phosphate transferase
MPVMLQFVIPAVITVLLVNLISPIARSVGLVDKPNQRKLHQNDVPLVGGIVISLAFMVSLLLFDISLREFRIIFFGLATVMIFGVVDDYNDTAALKKVLLQGLVALVIVVADDFVVSNIGDIFGRGYAQGLGLLVVPFSVIAIVGVINAFNMIDGLDGLAALTAIISLSAVLYLLDQQVGYKADEMRAVLIVFIVVLFVFSIFNLSSLVGLKRQIFLGDAGSTFIGLFIVFVLIELTKGQSGVLRVTVAPWLIGLPLIDMSLVIVQRTINRRSPFRADRGHIHHALLTKVGNKSVTLLMLLGFHSLLVLIGIFGYLRGWPDWIMFWGMLPILLGVNLSISRFR